MSNITKLVQVNKVNVIAVQQQELTRELFRINEVMEVKREAYNVTMGVLKIQVDAIQDKLAELENEMNKILNKD